VFYTHDLLLVQKLYSYDLNLSHNTCTSVTDGQTTTTMTIARPLLEYGRLKIACAALIFFEASLLLAFDHSGNIM